MEKAMLIPYSANTNNNVTNESWWEGFLYLHTFVNFLNFFQQNVHRGPVMANHRRFVKTHIYLGKRDTIWLFPFVESLKEYFSKFGPVAEAMVMRDPTTKHSRGFGFVTYADSEAVEKVIQFGIHNLDGKKIDPKVAFPKESTPKVRDGINRRCFKSFVV